jgi:cell division transport system permease protein
MIAWYIKRALRDIIANRVINAITVMTIALSVLMVSASLLFFINTRDALHAWQRGVRIMAYLKADVDPAAAARLKKTIESIEGVRAARFIGRDDALRQLKTQMRSVASLFDHLSENPLPDAYEIQLLPAAEIWEKIEAVAGRIAALKEVEEAEYGQRWVSAFRTLIRIFHLASIALTVLFLAATVFIVANTIRLVLYSRRQEVEIMRLVGAGDWFIRLPFYFQGLIQGLCGAALGLGMLFSVFSLLSSQLAQSALTGIVEIRFLPALFLGAIAAASMAVGGLGCHLSLRQFLRT